MKNQRGAEAGPGRVRGTRSPRPPELRVLSRRRAGSATPRGEGLPAPDALESRRLEAVWSAEGCRWELR